MNPITLTGTLHYITTKEGESKAVFLIPQTDGRGTDQLPFVGNLNRLHSQAVVLTVETDPYHFEQKC